jgi:hypothetical protein
MPILFIQRQPYLDLKSVRPTNHGVAPALATRAGTPPHLPWRAWTVLSWSVAPEPGRAPSRCTSQPSLVSNMSSSTSCGGDRAGSTSTPACSRSAFAIGSTASLDGWSMEGRHSGTATARVSDASGRGRCRRSGSGGRAMAINSHAWLPSLRPGTSRSCDCGLHGTFGGGCRQSRSSADLHPAIGGTVAEASRSVRGPSARTSIGCASRADVSRQPTPVVHHQQCDVVLGAVIVDELADQHLDDVHAGRVVCDRVES